MSAGSEHEYDPIEFEEATGRSMTAKTFCRTTRKPAAECPCLRCKPITPE